MMARRFWMTLGIGGMLLGWMTVPTRAQAVYTGQTAFQNLNISGSDEHRPGSMVVSGLARARSAVRNPAAPFDITETERPRSPVEELQIEAITTVLGEALDFWNFLLVQFLQRAGFDVTLPDDSGSPRDADGGKGGGRKPTLSPRTVLPRPTD